MTTYEAREAAWRKLLNNPDLTRADISRKNFDAGWNARGEYDAQQIAHGMTRDEELYGWLNQAWMVLGKVSRGEDVPVETVREAHFNVQRAKLRTSSLTSQQPDDALRVAALRWKAAVEAAERYLSPVAMDTWDLDNEALRAEDALRAALDGAPFEPSEEMVERAARAMWQFDVDHGQYTSPEPPSPPEPDDYEWDLARAALRAAFSPPPAGPPASA